MPDPRVIEETGKIVNATIKDMVRINHTINRRGKETLVPSELVYLAAVGNLLGRTGGQRLAGLPCSDHYETLSTFGAPFSKHS